MLRRDTRFALSLIAKYSGKARMPSFFAALVYLLRDFETERTAEEKGAAERLIVKLIDRTSEIRSLATVHLEKNARNSLQDVKAGIAIRGEENRSAAAAALIALRGDSDSIMRGRGNGLPFKSGFPPVVAQKGNGHFGLPLASLAGGFVPSILRHLKSDKIVSSGSYVLRPIEPELERIHGTDRVRHERQGQTRSHVPSVPRNAVPEQGRIHVPAGSRYMVPGDRKALDPAVLRHKRSEKTTGNSLRFFDMVQMKLPELMRNIGPGSMSLLVPSVLRHMGAEKARSHVPPVPLHIGADPEKALVPAVPRPMGAEQPKIHGPQVPRPMEPKPIRLFVPERLAPNAEAALRADAFGRIPAPEKDEAGMPASRYAHRAAGYGQPKSFPGLERPGANGGRRPPGPAAGLDRPANVRSMERGKSICTDSAVSVELDARLALLPTDRRAVRPLDAPAGSGGFHHDFPYRYGIQRQISAPRNASGSGITRPKAARTDTSVVFALAVRTRYVRFAGGDAQAVRPDRAAIAESGTPQTVHPAREGSPAVMAAQTGKPRSGQTSGGSGKTEPDRGDYGRGIVPASATGLTNEGYPNLRQTAVRLDHKPASGQEEAAVRDAHASGSPAVMRHPAQEERQAEREAAPGNRQLAASRTEPSIRQERAGGPPLTEAELHRVSDEVYRILERKLKIARERRGL